MFNPAAFLRPIAHRGLHDAASGIVENSAGAFAAAMARGYGIECDIRPARGGLPVVFHDLTLERLTDAEGPIAGLGATQVQSLRYRTGGEPMLTFSDLLRLVDGRVPLLVEIKSEWDPPDLPFLADVARQSLDYRGPLALMSFDPDVMAVMRELSPEVPRGIVSGGYKDEHGETWWHDRIDAARGDALANLLESGPAAPSFYAYHVKSLPTPVTRYVRRVQSLPVFTWTVRSAEDRAAAARHADATIFEGYLP